MSFEPVRVGVVGIGDISQVYLNAISRSPALELVSVAARRLASAGEVGQRMGVRAETFDEMLRDPTIELILNLTPGTEHERLIGHAISAGKHVYTEKPFALSRTGAEQLAAKAQTAGTLVGGAPDTFFGAAHQAARAALDGGAIGKAVFGQSFIGMPGLEAFHPNPAQFYRPGGEPPYDVGPYYFTQWINLLGPVRQVYASAGQGKVERTILRGPLAGTNFEVEVATTFNAILEFETASVTVTFSLDVVTPTMRPGDLFGSDGALSLADPLFFGGNPAITTAGGERTELPILDRPLSAPNHNAFGGKRVADYRGVGLVDLAVAIRTGRPHRTGPELLAHVAEVMEAVVRSAQEHRAICLTSTCTRPASIDPVGDALLVELTVSPFDPVPSASENT